MCDRKHRGISKPKVVFPRCYEYHGNSVYGAMCDHNYYWYEILEILLFIQKRSSIQAPILDFQNFCLVDWLQYYIPVVFIRARGGGGAEKKMFSAPPPPLPPLWVTIQPSHFQSSSAGSVYDWINEKATLSPVYVILKLHSNELLRYSGKVWNEKCLLK